jgi:hypothetical protein
MEGHYLMTVKLPYILLAMPFLLCLKETGYSDTLPFTSSLSTYAEPLSTDEIANLKSLFTKLIDAENRHDITAVKPLLWNSPATLFVAKTAVSYAGQTPLPKPFLIIMDWIRTRDGWRMASDIAIPVPPAGQDKSN